MFDTISRLLIPLHKKLRFPKKVYSRELVIMSAAAEASAEPITQETGAQQA